VRPPCEDPRDSARLGAPATSTSCPRSHVRFPTIIASSTTGRRLWESKHRSHVTLCDRSSEGGDSSFSSSSSSSSPSSSPPSLSLSLSLSLSVLSASHSSSELHLLHSARRFAIHEIRRRPRTLAAIFLADAAGSPSFSRIAGNELRRPASATGPRHAVLALGVLSRATRRRRPRCRAYVTSELHTGAGTARRKRQMARPLSGIID